MINISNVTKTYSSSAVKAVDSLNLTTRKGEIYGFLGPNGAGKTTTIKMITGILTPDSGSITVNGADLAREPIAAKRMIGYVPDNHSVYDKLTGREYLDFMADIYGVGIKERKERAGHLLELFSLIKDVDSQIHTYSHGMRQKICVIGALIHNPPLWILDEPMTGLDPQSAFELKKLMREHADNGNTVFFSTHILEVAEKLCDSIGIINKGQLIVSGTIAGIKKSSDVSLEQMFLSATKGAGTV